MSRDTWEASISHDVHKNASIMGGSAGYTVFVKCDECGILHEGMKLNTRLPAQVIAKKLKNAGWRLNGRAICPNHKKEKPVENAGTTAAPVSGQVELSASVASEKAKRAKRECLSVLEDVFNVEKGCYAKGESDDTVARTVQLAPAAVKQLREEFFGPIKRPPELDALFDQQDALQRSFTAFRDQTGHTMKTYEDGLTDLKRRIEAVAARYS